MKVKHFKVDDGYGSSLQTIISEWLINNQDIEIITSNYSTIQIGHKVEYSCIIFYKYL